MSIIPKNCNECGYQGEWQCTHAFGADIGQEQDLLPEMCPIKDDVLNAKRFKVTYRGENLYLLIAEREGKPWEIWAEHATNGDPDLKYMLAGWDCSTRFIAQSLKLKPLGYVIKQLRSSSRLKKDLPGIIADSLELWL